MHYLNLYLYLKLILTWALERYLQVPPLFWHRWSSPCSDSDLQLGAFLPLIHQCEFSTSFLSIQIKLEFCYEQWCRLWEPGFPHLLLDKKPINHYQGGPWIMEETS
jgi:hypothetical protein